MDSMTRPEVSEACKEVFGTMCQRSPVYREFDCYDSAARAPTPLPPTFDEGLENHYGDAVQPAIISKKGINGNVQSTRFTKLNSTAVLSDELLDHPDRERVCGKFEGSHLISQQRGTETSPADCHPICDIPYPEEIHDTEQSTLSRVELMPAKEMKETKQPTDSPLSACPSDISDWEEGKTVSLNRLKIAMHS
jgi:hypothetical protein